MLKMLSRHVARISFAVALVMTIAGSMLQADQGGTPNCHSTNTCSNNLTVPVSGSAPEIGLGALGSAMTLLSGGFLVVTSRRRRNR